jgi:hypothetical protein
MKSCWNTNSLRKLISAVEWFDTGKFNGLNNGREFREISEFHGNARVKFSYLSAKVYVLKN